VFAVARFPLLRNSNPVRSL